MIYAEWYDENGKFDNGFFDTWDEWYSFSFNPDINPIKIKEYK